MILSAYISSYYVAVGAILVLLNPAAAFVTTSAHLGGHLIRYRAGTSRSSCVGMKAFNTMANDSATILKTKILQLAAVMDRGGLANKGAARSRGESVEHVFTFVSNTILPREFMSY